MQIYDLLKQDHMEVRTMLNDLINLEQDDEYRFILVQEIKNALLPHSRAEEAVFYNAIRAVDADKSIVSHAYQEHMEAEKMLRSLEAKGDSDKNWRATAQKLLKALEHHISEEEGRVFTEARKIFSSQEAESIGQAFENLKPTYVGDGIVKNTVDLAINMLPPRIANGIRGLGNSKS